MTKEEKEKKFLQGSQEEDRISGLGERRSLFFVPEGGGEAWD